MLRDGRTGRRKDMKKLIVAFRDFVKAPVKGGTELWEHSVNSVSLTNNKFCQRCKLYTLQEYLPAHSVLAAGVCNCNSTKYILTEADKEIYAKHISMPIRFVSLLQPYA